MIQYERERIEYAMGQHKILCGKPFHRHCPEFVALGRRYIASGGEIKTWNPMAQRTVAANDIDTSPCTRGA